MTDPAALRGRIDQVRADGYAWSVEELVADAAGLAVPIRNSQGTMSQQRASTPRPTDCTPNSHTWLACLTV